MEEQLELQDAWKAVEKYTEIGQDTYRVLLERKKGWQKLDLKARSIMKSTMSENAQLSYKSIPMAGELWKQIKDDYGKVTMADQVQ